jgi:hypothetical protein
MTRAAINVIETERDRVIALPLSVGLKLKMRCRNRATIYLALPSGASGPAKPVGQGLPRLFLAERVEPGQAVSVARSSMDSHGNRPMLRTAAPARIVES